MSGELIKEILYGKGAQIVSEDNDCAVYRIENKTGQVQLTRYEIFPGIDLVYYDIHAQKYSLNSESQPRVFEIIHCREGRIECEYKDDFFYLSPGDIAIIKRDDPENEAFFPIRHYHGLSIMIDVDAAPYCLSCFLDDVDVQPETLMNKFCGEAGFFVMRAMPSLEHIFSELYTVQESIRRGYFKVKIMELLLFLSCVDMNENQAGTRRLSRSQVQLAKRACMFLSAHMGEKITIDQLSDLFNVSPTKLKNSFRGVYGESVYAYIREQKMQSAALLLKQTDLTILEIAGQYGYDNASKFAKAFRDVMGVSPNEYRSEARWGSSEPKYGS